MADAEKLIPFILKWEGDSWTAPPTEGARLRFVEEIVRRDPAQKAHVKGWRNRINSLSFVE